MIIEAWEPIWGGGQAHVFELSKKLIKNHGCTIDIFTMNLRDENNNEQKKIEESQSGNLRIIRVGKLRSFYSFKDRILWIFEVIRAISKNHKQEKYSLMHAHANLPGIPGKILSKLLRIPVVYTVHGSNFLDLNKKNILYIIEKFLFTKIKYNLQITVSKKFLTYKNANQAIYIPNGVDIEKFDTNYNELLKEKDGSKFKIIFVGRLDKIKGVDLLISAINKIKAFLRNKNVEIRLIGYGYDESKLKKQTYNLQLTDLVIFRGKLLGKELLKEYITADLFVLPSLSEGFPLTVLEAWAARLPVLVTEVGENTQLIENNTDGFIIPASNEEELARALSKAINLDNLKTIGTNGYKKARENYSWGNVAEKTYKAYERTIQ